MSKESRMSTTSQGQATSAASAFDSEALIEELRADAHLLPEKFQAYYQNYVERDTHVRHRSG